MGKTFDVMDTIDPDFAESFERKAKERKPTFDPNYIRDLSEKVYRLRLEQESPGNVVRMIAKDRDNGEKLRNRAAAYDPITRAYLKAIGIEP